MDIYTMNPDGSDQTRVTVGLEVRAWWNLPAAGPEGCLDWSSVHERFFYIPQGLGSRLYSLDVNGRNQIPLTDKVTLSFDLSPDGRRVAYLVSKALLLEIAVADIDGSKEKILTNEATRETLGIRTDSSLLGPTWSPDGQRIAFYSASSGNLSMVRSDGSDPVRLSADIGVRGAFKIDWSPDGQYIAFAVLKHQPPWFDLGTLEIASSQVNKLVEDGYAPAWSPDSSQIAFQRSDGQIWIINADGSGLTQLTSHGHNCCAIWIP